MDTLTRFEVSGFKNLENIFVDFGPFTCIAGTNSVGKSNLFDAIEFLSLLSDHHFLEACTLIRPTPQQRSDFSPLFSVRVIQGRENIRLAAEMIFSSSVSDEFNQQVEPERTFVRYEVEIAIEKGGPLSAGLQLRLVNELLSPIPKAKDHLRFPESGTYVHKFAHGTHKFIPLSSSTEENGNTIVQIRNGKRGSPERSLRATRNEPCCPQPLRLRIQLSLPHRRRCGPGDSSPWSQAQCALLMTWLREGPFRPPEPTSRPHCSARPFKRAIAAMSYIASGMPSERWWTFVI